ncbi:hypothetical protein ACFQZS_07665 [Mucilaginibacter calamicampi]|uniref:Outer membrane protein beta-barrel domain-containing protein n=1 Tax=Mucilaginibacter calamicampi TaxID=1302352 RepID=A0ABW2YU98_9SPHI
MRKLITVAALLFMSMGGYAQAIIGKMYTITPDFVNVYGVDANNVFQKQYKFRAPSNTKFTVTGFDTSHNIKITFWRYNTTVYDTILTEPQKITLRKNYAKTNEYYEKLRSKAAVYDFDVKNAYIGKWANYKEFAITPEEFDVSVVPYYGVKNQFTWGVMTLPIKLRLGDSNKRFFSYEEKLNLGFVFGLRHQLEGTVQKSINYIAGVGIANVRTDSLSLKSGITPASTSAAAFSINAGVLYAHGSFQIGAFIGSDYLTGLQSRDWKYQGKPWIGLAVGISLFSNTDTKGGEGTNEQKGTGDK